MIYSTMVVSRLCALAYWRNWNPGSWCLVLCRFEDQSFYCAPSGPEGNKQKKRICFFPKHFHSSFDPKAAYFYPPKGTASKKQLCCGNTDQISNYIYGLALQKS